jgi:hypothetical protein
MIDDLFLVGSNFEGHYAELVLRLAPYMDVAWLLEGMPEPAEQRLRMVQWLTAELALVEGRNLTVERAAVLLNDSRLLGDFVAARHRLYVDARRAGALFARCPHCGVEAKLSTAALEFRIGAVPPPLSTPDGVWPVPPAIGTRATLERGRRSGHVAMAARIRVEFPSHRLGLGSPDRPQGAVLTASLDDAAEAAAWHQHWPDNSFMPEDRPWWYAENHAFRALVRLSAAIAELSGGGAREASPESLERLPAIDVAYLDLAIAAAQFTDESSPADRRRPAGLACSGCGARYLPMF